MGQVGAADDGRHPAQRRVRSLLDLCSIRPRDARSRPAILGWEDRCFNAVPRAKAPGPEFEPAAARGRPPRCPGLRGEKPPRRWAIRRFIDPNASFEFVPRTRDIQKLAGIPFDVRGAELCHRDGRCTFESLLEKYELRGEAFDDSVQSPSLLAP